MDRTVQPDHRRTQRIVAALLGTLLIAGVATDCDDGLMTPPGNIRLPH